MPLNPKNQGPTKPDGANRRRSGRVMLTVPLRARGLDANGLQFERDAETISVNRHGAHIQLDQPLVPGGKLLLANLARQSGAEFRVIGYLGSGPKGVAEWGVEAVSPEADLWGIHFPAPQDSAPAISALAECQQCETIALLQLSEIEAEVLEAGALILRGCPRCQAETCWGIAEKSLLQGIAETIPPEKVQERRRVRHYVQRVVTIRDASGAVEKVRTENVSQNGVCCTCARNYESGQTVTLSWPHSSEGRILEARARVARRHDLGGSSRRIYGFEYEAPPVLLTKVVRAPLRLYWAFVALIVAAAALAGTAIYSLAAALKSPTQDWTPPAELVTVLLLLYFSSLVFNAIRKAEPGSQARQRRELLLFGKVAVPVVAALVVVCAVAGIRSGTRRASTRQLLADITVARTLESHLDSAETSKPADSQDYSDLCATLKPLAAEWQLPLNRLSEDVSRTRGGGSGFQNQLRSLDKLVQLDRQKLQVVAAQTALAGEAAQQDTAEQLAFWQKNFDPLQAEYQQLNARRDALIASFPAHR